MADTFEGLGIRAELAAAAAELGYERPTPLQVAAVPVVRRGGNAVLHASSGAGVVAAYGLALLDRLADGGEEEVSPRALVLAPTEDAASGIAASLARLGRPAGVRAAALGRGWRADDAAILVATADAAIDAVRGSRLKLDALQAFVLHDAAALLSLAEADALESLTSSLPKDAQRIVTSPEPARRVDDFVERHVRKAMAFPSRPADARAGKAPAGGAGGSIEYVIVAEAEKPDAAARLLAAGASMPIRLVCRTTDRAAGAAEALALRGYDPAGLSPLAAAEAAGEGGTALGWDPPFDADQLGRHFAAGGVIMVTAREMAHLRRIAELAGLKLVPRPLPGGASDQVEAHRGRLRAAMREEDIPVQLLVLQPLFDEFSAAEVAAAASALLRRGESTAKPKKERSPAASPVGARPPTWTRLFVSIGSRDELRPGDLVGAITGEANVTGEQVGKIEIRDTFSVVEVTTDVAERVISALNGTTLRGRSLRVDFDRQRKAATGGRPTGGRPAAGRPSGGRPAGGRSGGPGGRGGPPGRSGPGGGPGRRKPAGPRPPRRGE